MRPNRDLSFLSQELEELESDMTRTMECILDPYAVKVVDEEYRIWQCVFNVFKVIPKWCHWRTVNKALALFELRATSETWERNYVGSLGNEHYIDRFHIEHNKLNLNSREPVPLSECNIKLYCLHFGVEHQIGLFYLYFMEIPSGRSIKFSMLFGHRLWKSYLMNGLLNQRASTI